MKRKILYFDMDNVLVDFPSGIDQLDKQTRKEFEGRYDEVPHIFSKMKPLHGAIEAFGELSELFDTYILSTSPWDNDTASGDKLRWVKKYLLPNAYKRLILSHHKNLNIGDYLIDDRAKNGAGEFTGEHIHFGTEQFPDWKSVVEYLKQKI
jgi:5'-nucleotidase